MNCTVVLVNGLEDSRGRIVNLCGAKNEEGKCELSLHRGLPSKPKIRYVV